MKRKWWSSLIILMLIFSLTLTAYLYKVQNEQAEVIRSAIILIDSYKSRNLDLSVGNDKLLMLNEKLLSNVQALEQEKRDKTCRSISYDQFINNVPHGTDFVITPYKMGWENYWEIHQDVILDRDYGIARGYEFRVELTPENNFDSLQEIHTTVVYYADPDIDLGKLDMIPLNEANYESIPINLDLDVPYRAFFDKNDPSFTTRIEFQCGSFNLNVKSKHIDDLSIAIPMLEKAVMILYGELTQWAK